ncbi:MAG TPA: hypothetical protein VEV43_10015 [Actinomycetota bacterium]|nr:hypothetical protein [Actinomycetota bacterium]
MRDAPEPKSIEVFLAEVHDQLAAQRSHVESLDAKAGVVLGFSGLLAAVAPDGNALWMDLARGAAIFAGIFALFGLLPRGYAVVDLRAFQRDFLTAQPTTAQLVLFDTQLNVLADTAGVIDHKSRRLRASIAALLVAIIFAYVGPVT